MNTYKIEKTLVLSAYHIPKNDSDKLTKDGFLTSWPNSFGFVLYTLDHENIYQEFSVHLRYLIKLARALDCTYLKLDTDVTLDPNLQSFQW